MKGRRGGEEQRRGDGEGKRGKDRVGERDR